MKESMERNWEERTVTVSRGKLLTTLKENLKKHVSEYNLAVAGYKEQAKERLVSLKTKILSSVEENFENISKRIEKFDPQSEDSMQDIVSLVNTTAFTLQVPKSYEKSYSVAIQMAEWEVSDTIELKQSQFQCFVLDDWDWKGGFERLSKTYMAKSF